MYDSTIRARALDMVADGQSLNSVANLLGISRSALRVWTQDLDGRAGGARPCPAPLEPSADYAALFGYYLGDGHISRCPRYYALRISCDTRYPSIIEDVERVLSSAHPDRPTCRVKAPGCVVVQSSWKHWPCLFPQHGPGRKHERTLGMEPWQWVAVEAYPADFLHGLFHSDGCLVKNWATRPVGGHIKRYDYPRWQFVNASEEILGWCADALDLIGVAWKRSGPRTISVSRRADVARLTALIGEKA